MNLLSRVAVGVVLGGLCGLLIHLALQKTINKPLEVGDRISAKVAYDLPRDGDSFHLVGYGKDKFRLTGIDAPESKQNCTRGPKKEEVWACGMESIRAFDRIVDKRKINCVIVKKDLYPHRWDVTCNVGNVEINEWMVRAGWAMAYEAYSKRYVAAEKEARAAKRGIWANDGALQKPWDFRKEKR